MKKINLKLPLIFLSLVTAANIAPVFANGNSVDKVYNPYVQAQEKEIELRSISQKDNKPELDNLQTHRLGIGKAITDDVFTELYLIGKKTKSDDLDADAMELELKIQLTEQGEYDEDWGLLFEYEKGFGNNINDFLAGLLTVKEYGRFTGTLNLFLEYEWGSQIRSELEAQLSSQLRYRYSRLLEPAIEFYQSQDTTSIGPVIMGNIRFARAKKLHWETGLLFGLRAKTPDHTLRLMLEYEF